MMPATARGLSDALGVITLLSVVIVVGATTGLLSVVFYTPPPVTENPDTTWGFDYNRSLTAGDSLTVEHTGGDALYSDRVRIEISGTNDEAVNGAVYWANLTDDDTVRDGDQVVLDQTTLSGTTDSLDLSAATVRIVAEGDTDSDTIGRWTGPEA